MSFKIVSLLKNSHAFDLKELVHRIIDSAVELHRVASDKSESEGDGLVGSTDRQQQVSEMILFLLESMRADPQCVASPNLVRLVETVGYSALQQRSHSEETKQSVYQLLAAILSTPNGSEYQELKSGIRRKCVESLCKYSEEQRLLVSLTLVENVNEKCSCVFSMKDVLEILYYTFETVGSLDTDSEYAQAGVEDPWFEDCFECLLDVLEFSEAATCSHVSGILLPKLLGLSRDKHSVRLAAIWKRLLGIHRTFRKSKHTSNVYIALCGLSEFYIPGVLKPSISDQSAASSSLLTDDGFWRVVQTGLVHTDPLARKQACFLLKRSIESVSLNHSEIPDELHSASGIGASQGRSSEPGSSTWKPAAIFWWSADSQKKLLAVWGDFFLMYETLDEIQVHVVTPVMPRMKSLIQAASTLHSSDRPILHPSWLTVLFSRCFVHETRTVFRWGLLEYLRLDIKSCPMWLEGGTEFLLGTVLPVLNDDNLYSGKSQDGVTRPLIAVAFTRFMQSCIEILGTHSKVFLREFVAAVSRQFWSPVSLTFVFDALTHLPECSAWGPTELQRLREMQFSCVGMMSFTYRSVVQCLMLQAVLRLLDRDTTSLPQLSGLLGLFNNCLRRGSALWNQVCEWFKASQNTQVFGARGDLAAAVLSEVTALLVVDPCSLSNASMDLADSGEPTRVACLVLLAVDAQYTSVENTPLPSNHPSDSESYLQRILAPLTSILSCIGSHIYVPVIKADTGLQLLHGILQYLLHPSADDESVHKGKDRVRQEMFSLLSSCQEEIYSFINRRLLSSDIAQSADINRVLLYISVLESTHTFLKKSPRYSLLRNVVASGQTRLMECCKLLMTQSTGNKQSNPQLGYFQTFVACRLLLWLLQMNRGSDLLRLPWDTLSPLLTFKDDATTLKDVPDANATTSLRRISNLFMHTKWQCLGMLLQDCEAAGSLPFPVSQPDEVILAACVRDLTLFNGLDAVPIMQCAKVLVNRIGQDTIPLCLDLVDAAWSTTLDEWRGTAQTFWLLYSSAVELIFQQCFLVAEEGTEIHRALGKVISSILTLGGGKPKIVTVFAKHLCSQWASQLDDEESRTSALRAVSNQIPLLIEICSMGSKINKDIRLQQDISVYLLQLSFLEAVKDDITACVEQRSGQRRVILTNFLLLIATAGSAECCQIINAFLQGLLKKFLELKTSTLRSYTMNTQLHRQNIRVWQTLLVFVPYVDKERAGQMLEDVLASVVGEKQSSVRYLMIWTATQLMMLVPSLEEKVWDYIQKLRGSMETNVCPLLTLIAHLGMVQPEQRKESFYQRAFPVVFPWALIQTSSIRHLALLCVKKMWQDCTQAGLSSVTNAFPLLQSCMGFLQDGKSAVPSPNKPDSYFYLFKVHPVQDYTMETVFHILPALSSLPDDQLLQPQLFEKDCPSLWSSSHKSRPVIGLYNPERSLIQEEYRTTLTVQPSSLQAGPDDSFTNSASEACNKETNVQKKIIPWQDTLMPGFEDVMKTAGREEKGSKKGSLVLVASLIDKAPNLGGLCRTSQIFGVAALVVGNLRVTADRVFQTLSVTAEKWLPIIEVPVSELSSYLQAMRHRGYTLVGVEQTARSQCLTKYQFPERTLLLLGHERTGIPVELIQLLDVCVEIPQQGIIRSLNVHVSGALLIWEYTRQRLLAQSTK